MLPLRRFGVFVSRISLTIVLLLTSIFVVFGFAQYLFQTDTPRFAPAHRHVIKKDVHHHHGDTHAETLRQVNAIVSQPIVKEPPSSAARVESIERTAVVEKRRLLQLNDTFVPETTKIGKKSVSVFVHFDLKGAPPKVAYFEQLFPLLRKWGATGVCMEYEDMFPFEGVVDKIKHKQAYSKDDIDKINSLARENRLEVMPLLQTYGHLEFLLKLEEFSDLRENAKYPQVITPCVNRTYTVLFAMIDQYLALHPNMRYFHIGHDEVYYFLSHPACVAFRHATGIDTQHALFAHHLNIIVKYIHEKNPQVRLFVWHDVLQNLNVMQLQQYELLNNIVPVLWSYREDMSVEGFVVGPQSSVFGQYKSLWGASAFKGSTDEIATVSDIKHHYDNQVSWIKQLNSYIPGKWTNFDGIMITGWSRYDHFLSLCELLPYSIPSLAFSLAAWREPFKSQPTADIFQNRDLQQYVQRELGCASPLHLTALEHTVKSAPKCQFPGYGVYEALLSLPALWTQVKQAESFVNKFVTELHVKYEYIHVKRGEECLEKLAPVVPVLRNFLKSFTKAMDEVFPSQVAVEWLETYFMKDYRAVMRRYDFIQRAIKEQRSWLPRPIPDSDKLDEKEKSRR